MIFKRGKWMLDCLRLCVSNRVGGEVFKFMKCLEHPKVVSGKCIFVINLPVDYPTFSTYLFPEGSKNFYLFPQSSFLQVSRKVIPTSGVLFVSKIF